MTAAGELILQAGFQHATMDAVAAEAGVSKQTVYSHFGSKDELLRACVNNKMRDHQVLPDDLPVATDARTALTEVAARMVELLQDPEVIAMMRVMIGELGQPDISRTFLAEGPDQAVEFIAELLLKLERHGEITVQDARDAAQVFTALVRGHFVLRALLGDPVDMSADERRRHVTATVDRFMKLCEAGLC
ncbi:MAG: TetR/AcrR family transcriptional regulator [Chromatiales bacterium]|nr:MAG: TetR/AcrR family transcriptional regulator [Chromatiales bacterium]